MFSETVVIFLTTKNEEEEWGESFNFLIDKWDLENST